MMKFCLIFSLEEVLKKSRPKKGFDKSPEGTVPRLESNFFHWNCLLLLKYHLILSCSVLLRAKLLFKGSP